MEKNYIETNVTGYGKVRVKFYGHDKEIYKIYCDIDEFNRQRSIKHLGLSTLIFDGSNHTRFDYLAMQCTLVELLNNINKGLQNVKLGEIRIGKIRYDGCSLIKTWFLLSNMGHCFNTFADEKVLLRVANEDKELKRHILNQIKDNDLKKWASQIISDLDYRKFHFVLAFYRLYKSRFNMRNNHEIILPLKALVLNDVEGIANKHKISQLKNIYNTIRKISIISLDSEFSHVPFSINSISSLVSLNMWENYFFDQHFIDQLKPFYNLLESEIYLNPKVLAVYKQYENKAFKEIENKRLEVSWEDIIDMGMYSGYADIKSEMENYIPFIRINLNNYKGDVYDYDMELSKMFNDESILYLVDYISETNQYFVDIYIGIDISNSSFALMFYNICNLINMQIDVIAEQVQDEYFNDVESVAFTFMDEKTKTEYNNRIQTVWENKVIKRMEETTIPLFMNLLWSTLKYFVKDKYTFDVIKSNGKYNSFGINFEYIKSLTLNLKSALKVDNIHVDRVHELMQLNYSCKSKKTGYVLGCIDRIEVMDITKPPESMTATDIDGLLIHSTSNSFTIEFHESKNTKKPFNDAKKDINSKLKSIFNSNITGARVREVKGYGAKYLLNIKF